MTTAKTTSKTDAKTQNRGVCQCCGRFFAVLATGRMSKHGYTVKNGWFAGVCGGQNVRPMQVDRTIADQTIAAVRAECLTIRDRAARMERGDIDPVFAGQVWNFETRAYDGTPFAEASVWEQRDARRSEVWRLTQRAEMGESFANMLERLADQYHGQPLQVVTIEAGPAPILCGDQRQAAHRTVACTSVQGARVYWKDGDNRKGWMSTQAWRRMPAA